MSSHRATVRDGILKSGYTSVIFVDMRAKVVETYYCIGIGLSRYIAVTNLSIITVFVEYLRQFLIDLNQIYRHSSVPKNTSP